MSAPTRLERLLDLETIRAMGGRLVPVPERRPMVLDDTRRMWLVYTGAADVMTSRVYQGRPVGRRRFLFNGGPGTPLFPVSRGGEGTAERLIVLASEGLTLVEAPLRVADQVLAAAGIPFHAAMEEWVARLSAFAGGGPGDAIGETLPGEGRLAIPDGTRIRVSPGRVAWLEVEEGSLHVLGSEELRIGKHPFPIPIGSDLWMQARGDVEVRVHGARHGYGNIGLIRGLALFSSLLQARLELIDAAERGAERARLAETDEQDRRALGASLERMAQVLNPREGVAGGEDPLLDAIALVGRALGPDVRDAGASVDLRRERDRVEAIARASRLRYRSVLLAGDWWRHDNGPLLAYLHDGHRPVAVLPTGAGAYELIDPQTQSAVAVDESTALQLEPKAVMFYRRLPEAIDRAWQIPRWALRGRLTDILSLLGLALLVTLLGMLVPMATALIVDHAIPDTDRRLLLELGLALLAAAFGRALFLAAQGVLGVRIGMISESVGQSGMWDRLLGASTEVFRRFSKGDLLDRAMAVSAVNREINGQAMRSLLTSAMALLNLVLMYWYSPLLASVALGLGAVVVGATLVLGRMIRRHYRALMEMRGAFFGFVVELVGAVGKIRVAGAQRRAFARWAEKYTAQLERVVEAQRLEDYATCFNQAVPLLSAILVYAAGARLLAESAAGAGPGLSVGVFLAFNVAMATFLAGVTDLGTMVLDFLDTLAKAERTRPLLEAPTEVDGSRVDPGPLRGAIAFSNVDFRYSPTGPRALRGLSFRVNPEEFVALVGPSGSGKSTVFRLLLGFERCESGSVTFDGQDLSGLDLTAVRRQLGVVLQISRINSDSIFDNIAAGANVSVEEAWLAAEDAGLADDIREMPMGMHTVVSEGATNLSGGQRQRLLVARALVRNPRILLFDEATSALDNRTQQVVSRALERRRVSRLVIAHRLSTIRHADRIYVLRDGAVAESGTFDELARASGVFASMMARQIA